MSAPPPHVVKPERFPLFDPMRLIAATLVIVSHSYAIVGDKEPWPLRVGNYSFTWGFLAVAVFFVTSGFLVSASWERIGSGRFAWRRAWRIFPGYLTVITLSAFVLGPLVTELKPISYFTDPDTWRYWIQNAVMIPGNFHLPGVFVNQPTTAVNGSLWTLPYEVLAYAGLATAGAIGLLRRARYVIAGYLGFLAAYWLVIESERLTVTSTTAYEFVLLIPWFVGGALAWHYRHLVVGRHPFVPFVAVLFALGAFLHSSPLILPTLSWLIIYAGTLRVRYRRGMATAGNVSYGVYLYAWPVQQTLYWLGMRSAWAVTAVTTPIALAFGCASWNLIEKRGIARGRARWPSLPVFARNPLRRKVSPR